MSNNEDDDDRPYICELMEGNMFSRSRKLSLIDGEWRLGWWRDPPKFEDEDEDDEELIRELNAPIQRGEGIEFIEVVELVESSALKLIAVYRRWVIDPQGNEINSYWASKRRTLRVQVESRLRGTLNSGAFYHGNTPPSWRQQQQIDERERERLKGPVLITMARIEKLKSSASLIDSDLSFLNDLRERAEAMKKRSVYVTYEEWRRLSHLEYAEERRKLDKQEHDLAAKFPAPTVSNDDDETVH